MFELNLLIIHENQLFPVLYNKKLFFFGQKLFWIEPNSLQVYAWCPGIIAIIGIVNVLRVYSTVTQEGYPLEGTIDGYLLWALLPYVIGLIFTLVIYFSQRKKKFEEMEKKFDK